MRSWGDLVLKWIVDRAVINRGISPRDETCNTPTLALLIPFVLMMKYMFAKAIETTLGIHMLANQTEPLLFLNAKQYAAAHKPRGRVQILKK